MKSNNDTQTKTATGPPGNARRASLVAAAITLLVLCAGNATAGAFPFGDRTRNVNDLGNQYVPFHTRLWDLLHGQADGDLLLNWQSGFGSSFLPDYGTYLSSPFAPLVAFFPRDRIDVAVFVITLVKMAVAAALMAAYLLRLRSGAWWAAGLLGASYGLCGWALADAVYNTMWLDGLIALPLLFLVTEWALAGRRTVLSALVVALCWVANFYTAYMATLAAGLLLLARLGAAPLPWRARGAVLLRAAFAEVVGVGLAAPVVFAVYFGTRYAYPGRTGSFTPIAADDLLTRLLPATYSFSSPALYVDAVALLLALSLPFNRAVPRRVRAALSVLVLVAAASLQWAPTNLMWNGFATPNGSPYRAAFIVCGLLVVAAWTSFAYGPPQGRPLLAALALTAAFAALASDSDVASAWTLPTTVAGTTLAGVALWYLARPPGSLGRSSRTASWCLVLLCCVLIGQSVATTAYTERLRVARKDDYAPWGERQETQRAAIARVDAWPRYRTDPGREQTVGNDPLVVGGQGGAYYSSVTSDVLARTLTALGGGYTSRGRSVQSVDNPVVDVVFSVGARLRTAPDPHQNWYPDAANTVDVVRRPVPPLVTVHPATVRREFGDSAFRNQELMLGESVYTLPRLTFARAGSSVRSEDGRHAVPGRSDGWRVSGTCPAGTGLHLWAPRYSGTARQAHGREPLPTGRFRADQAPVTKTAAVQFLGTVPASGRFTIRLDPEHGGFLPTDAVGCLHTDRLRAAAERLRATGARAVHVDGHSVRATLPPRSTGVAVLAAPRIPGWRCATGDDSPRPAEHRLGLIAVPLDGRATELRCEFRPPGLRAGTCVALIALLALCTFAGLRSLRGRTTSLDKPC
ncbi:YfhO family protein [Streptomyces sp. NPDC085931]|uniref:YfhO family protein n=1 Tax=Streptomyces sp. NPDC085931 TaxID=3365740 RepID=UPI0037D4E170